MRIISHSRHTGQSGRAAFALTLTLALVGCSTVGNAPDEQASYCLSAGKDQSFDCNKPAVEAYAGPLRIRDLPIDDATLYARVEEIRFWLAQQRAVLSGEPLDPPQAGNDPTLIPPAPEAHDQPVVQSDPVETLVAALALTERGDHGTALSLIDEYRTLHPDDLSATLVESRILLQSGDPQSAEELLRWQIKQTPRVPELYNNLAAAQAAAGKVGDAIATLQQAFATDPSFAQIQQNLKTLYSASANQALLPDSRPLAPKLNMIDLIPSRD